MRMIGDAGTGVVVLISRPTEDSISRAIRDNNEGNVIKAIEEAPPEQRDYGVGAQILAELGVRDMVLLTNTRHALVGLEGYGLSIVGEQPITSEG